MERLAAQVPESAGYQLNPYQGAKKNRLKQNEFAGQNIMGTVIQ